MVTPRVLDRVVLEGLASYRNRGDRAVTDIAPITSTHAQAMTSRQEGKRPAVGSISPLPATRDLSAKQGLQHLLLDAKLSLL